MRYQVLTIIFLAMIISLSAMNSEYVTRFGESSTSFRLNNMIIDNGRLYLCKEYGVDIFEIGDNGELSLQSTVIADDVNNFTIYNNNLYFACRPFSSDTWETIVYKYDVSDPVQPVETGQLELDYPPYTMYIWHDMLTIVDFLVTRQLLYYNPVTLEYIDREVGSFLKPFYEDYWCTNDPDTLTIYDLSDPFNAVEITSVDLELVNNGYFHVCRRITDDLYVVYSQSEMSLWDTSDFSNWQLLSQLPFPEFEHLFYDMNIEIWDETILLPLVEIMLVVDISNPELPQVSQVLSPALFNPTNCLKHGDYIYLVDNSVGIQVLNINDDIVQLGEICTNFPKLGHGLRKGDNLLREKLYQNQEIPDLYIWDTSNPDSPQLSAELDLEAGRMGGKILADMLILKNEEDFNIEIYDISNLPDISLLSSIDCFENQYEYLYGNFYVFEDEIDKFYIKKPPDQFVCYDISDPQNPEELFEITEENCFISYKHGDYLYLIESVSSDGLDLIIYSGIDSNNPQLSARYVNFMPENSILKIYQDKLFMSDCDDDYTTQVYDLNGSEEPEFLCSLSVDFGGRITYYGGEYIVCSIHDAYSFYIPENPPLLIEPSCHIGRFNFICNLEVISSGLEDYLYVFDTAYTEVYQVEDTLNDENLITENVQMIIYPNPFSFDNGQEITFYSPDDLSRYSKDAFLSLYNIKGQLVHQQKSEFDGNNPMSWDCRLQNGTKVPSGVYLYKVDTGKKSSSGKFIITK